MVMPRLDSFEKQVRLRVAFNLMASVSRGMRQFHAGTRKPAGNPPNPFIGIERLTRYPTEAH